MLSEGEGQPEVEEAILPSMMQDALGSRVMAEPSTLLGMLATSLSCSVGSPLGPQSVEAVQRNRTRSPRLPSVWSSLTRAVTGMQRMEEKVMHQPRELAQPG